MIWIVLVAMVAMHAIFLWKMRAQIARGDPDFTAYYTAGRIVASGQGADLYDPAAQLKVQREFSPESDLRHGPLRYIHPPFEALLFVPFASLPYSDAFIAWDVLNLCLILVAAILLQSMLASHIVQVWEVALALLAFFPIFANIFQGQDAIFLLVVVALVFRAMESRADFIAGCWLGVGLFRYQIAIPLVVILALWGRRRLLLGFFTASAGAVLLSVAVAGWHASLRYPSYLWTWASVGSFGRTPPSLLPNLMGLLTGWPGLGGWPLRSAALMVSLGLLVAVAWKTKKLADDPRLFRLAFGSALITSLLVSFNTSTYDLCLLVLPLVLVGDHCLRLLDLRQRGREPWALVLPALPLLLSPLWFLIGIQWQQFNLMAVFLIWWLYAISNEMLRMRANLPQPHSSPPF